MAKMMKRATALFLALMLCLGNLVLPVTAVTEPFEDAGTSSSTVDTKDHDGNNVKVEVTVEVEAPVASQDGSTTTQKTTVSGEVKDHAVTGGKENISYEGEKLVTKTETDTPNNDQETKTLTTPPTAPDTTPVPSNTQFTEDDYKLTNPGNYTITEDSQSKSNEDFSTKGDYSVDGTQGTLTQVDTPSVTGTAAAPSGFTAPEVPDNSDPTIESIPDEKAVILPEEGSGKTDAELNFQAPKVDYIEEIEDGSTIVYPDGTTSIPNREIQIKTSDVDFRGKDITVVIDGKRYEWNTSGNKWKSELKTIPELGIINGSSKAVEVYWETVDDDGNRIIRKYSGALTNHTGGNKDEQSGGNNGNASTGEDLYELDITSYVDVPVVPGPVEDSYEVEIKPADVIPADIMAKTTGDNPKYTIEEIRENGKLVGWRAVPTKGSTAAYSGYKGESETPAYSSSDSTEQILDPNEDGWEKQFADAGDTVKTESITDTDGNVTGQVRYFTKTNTDGSITTVKVETTAQTNADGTTTFVNPVYYETKETTTVTPSTVQEGLTAEEFQTYFASAGTYTNPDRPSPAAIEHNVDGKLYYEVKAEDGTSTFFYGSFRNEVPGTPVYTAPVKADIETAIASNTADYPAADGSGNTLVYGAPVEMTDAASGNKYFQVPFTAYDADGNVVYTETKDVFGETVTTTTYTQYDALTKQVTTYTKTTTGTATSAKFIQTTLTETNTWTAEYVSGYSETLKTEEFILKDKTQDMTFSFGGTMYPVHDEDEGDAIDADAVTNSSVKLNSKDNTANTLNTDITLEIKDRIFSDSMVAVVKVGDTETKFCLGGSTFLDSLTGTITAETESVNGVTVYTLHGVTLANGAETTITLQEPTAGTYTIDTENAGDVAAAYDAKLSVKMVFSANVPEFEHTTVSETNYYESKTNVKSTKTLTSSKVDEYTAAKIINVSAPDTESIAITANVFTGTETETVTRSGWAKLRSIFTPDETTTETTTEPEETTTETTTEPEETTTEATGNPGVPAPMNDDGDPAPRYRGDTTALKALTDLLLDIPEEEVPLAAVPVTGDPTLIYGIVSALSLGAVFFLKKKDD